MLVKTVYFLRHGDTGMDGRYIGTTDVPLNAGGCRQIGRTARLLRQEKIGKILCSPMLRCRQTRDLLDLHCPCEYHDTLREVNFGRWEGKRFIEITQMDADLVESWIQDPAHFSFPDGESTADFQERLATVHEMLLAAVEERLLLVTHGGVIRHLLCLMLGLPLEKYLAFDVQPGAFSSLHVYSEGSVLTGFNLKG